jgi:hypothetical protein
MWIPQFGDRLCEFCGEMGGCQEMGCVMCDCSESCEAVI